MDQHSLELAAIAAMGQNRVIGYQNRMPWHLPADLKHFKQVTSPHPIIMGHKTYLSIGRLLPNRLNIILTRQDQLIIPGAAVVKTQGEALAAAKEATTGKAFVIGGGEIYRLFWPDITTLYLTEIHHPFEGDTFFPEFTPHFRITSCEEHKADADNPYHYAFLTLKRNQA